MRLVLMGPPGAGKGTQGERLADRLGVSRYATGDMLRQARREGSELGRRVGRYMDAGELVPDDVILAIVREVVGGSAAPEGFVLDGFPRTVPQAEGLARVLDGSDASLDLVIYLDVPEEELERRLTGRRVCVGCGAVARPAAVARGAGAPGTEPFASSGVTGGSDEPRCPECGGDLVRREDDRPETVRRRLEVYRRQTEPVLHWYRDSNVPVREVDGTGSVDEVTKRIGERLEG